MLALMWFLLIRPQRTRQASQAQMLANLEVGDEIITAGGVYGHIRHVGEDDLSVEVAPGTTLRVAKRAVAAVVEPEDEEADRDEADAAAVEDSAEPATDNALPDEAGHAESPEASRR